MASRLAFSAVVVVAQPARMAATKSTPLVCRGHTRPLTCLSFSSLEPDGSSYLISGCKDSTPMLRDGVTGDWLGSFLGHKGCAWSIKLCRNTERAISGSADFSAKIWDSTDGSCVLTLPHEHIVRCGDLNNDGSRAVTGGHEKKLRLWDVNQLLQQQQQHQQILDQNGAEANAPISPLLTPWSCKLLVADEKQGTAHDGTIKNVIWDELNNQIISAGDDKKVKFWSIDKLQCKNTITFDEPITSMERCHDERVSICITHGNTVDFLDPQSWKIYLSHTLKYPVSSASIHPRGLNTFVTGSVQDGWVRVHDSNTGEEKEMYKGHHGPVHAISYSPDGEIFASASEDGTIRLHQTTAKTYGLWVASTANGHTE